MKSSGQPELHPRSPRPINAGEPRPKRQVPPCSDGSTRHHERIHTRDGKLIGICKKCGLEKTYRKKPDPLDLHDYVIRDRVRDDEE